MFNAKRIVQDLQQERKLRVVEVQKIGEAISVLNGLGAKKNNVVEMPKRRHMSAAGRRRIRDAQRARWAKIKAEKAQPAVKKAKHWTQLPKNQARVRRLLRKATRARLSA